jgi:hypothetical protein
MRLLADLKNALRALAAEQVCSVSYYVEKVLAE